MKMTTFMALSLFFCASLAHSQGLDKLKFSDQTGIYSLESDNASGECPARVRVVQKMDDEISFSAIGAPSSLVFTDGEKEKIKLNSKETYELEANIEDTELRLEGRHCRGKIFKKCDDWQVLAMVNWIDDGLSISHRTSPYLPKSGFPNGTCSYLRGL